MRRCSNAPGVVRKIGNSDFSTKPTNFYNLDVIISVGYRVKSHRGTQFRIWATQRLREYIIKGFTLDDQRLKHGGNTNLLNSDLAIPPSGFLRGWLLPLLSIDNLLSAMRSARIKVLLMQIPTIEVIWRFSPCF